MATLQLENISCQFTNGQFGLREVNLSIGEGEFLVVAGANGSGKTTLCRLLNGLQKPTEGRVLLDGVSIFKNIRKTRQDIGVVFQNADQQIVGETVEADVAFGPENLKLSRDEIECRVQTALEAVGLTNFRDSHPYLLSGGEKKRLTIAGVLAMNPKILVFDEPFSNLDYPGSLRVLKRIVQLCDEGRTIILITHDLEPVMARADRLIVLKDGRIVQDGNPAEIAPSLKTFGVRPPPVSEKGGRYSSWLN